MAAMELITPRPRSEWPCQSTFTAGLVRATRSLTKRISVRTPQGVAWPTVSHTQTLPAPAWMAAVYIFSTSSGLARVVSSVTYITGSPSETANSTAFADCRTIQSRSHSSANWRMGDDPMKVQASMGMPTRWEISAMGRMSFS
jgi:hypothetical protein